MPKTKIKKVLIFAKRSDILGSENIFALSKDIQVLISDSLYEIKLQLTDPFCRVMAFVVNPVLLRPRALPELVELIKMSVAKFKECRIMILNPDTKQNQSTMLHMNIIRTAAVTHLMAPVHIDEIFKLLDLPLNYLDSRLPESNAAKDI